MPSRPCRHPHAPASGPPSPAWFSKCGPWPATSVSPGTSEADGLSGFTWIHCVYNSGGHLWPSRPPGTSREPHPPVFRGVLMLPAHRCSTEPRLSRPPAALQPTPQTPAPGMGRVNAACPSSANPAARSSPLCPSGTARVLLVKVAEAHLGWAMDFLLSRRFLPRVNHICTLGGKQAAGSKF